MCGQGRGRTADLRICWGRIEGAGSVRTRDPDSLAGALKTLPWSHFQSHSCEFRAVRVGSNGSPLSVYERSQRTINPAGQTSKACVGETPPWVQIPPPPLLLRRDARSPRPQGRGLRSCLGMIPRGGAVLGLVSGHDETGGVEGAVGPAVGGDATGCPADGGLSRGRRSTGGVLVAYAPRGERHDGRTRDVDDTFGHVHLGGRSVRSRRADHRPARRPLRRAGQGQRDRRHGCGRLARRCDLATDRWLREPREKGLS